MIAKINQFCDVIKGKTGIQKARNGQYPMITTKKERITHTEYQFDSPAVCIPLVSATGHGHASLKIIHYIEGKFALGSILAAVIPKNKERITAKYLYIYFNGFKDKVLVPLMQGTANVSLKIKDIENIEIFLPSFEKQNEVVEKYDSINNQYSNLNKNQTKNRNLVNKLRQAILSEAVQGKLVLQDPNDEPASVLLEKVKAEKEKLIREKKIRKEKPLPPISEDEIPYELPKGWEWSHINDIAFKVTDGEHATPLRANKGYHLLSARNITNQGINLSKVDYVEEDEFNRIRKRCDPDINDILISCSGSVGRVCLVDKSNTYVMVRSAALIKPYHENIYSKYLCWCLRSNAVQNQIINKSRQMAQANLFLGKIKEIIFPLPPYSEQKRIVKKIDQLMQLCDQLESQIKENQKNSEALMNAVLREAFEVE